MSIRKSTNNREYSPTSYQENRQKYDSIQNQRGRKHEQERLQEYKSFNVQQNSTLVQLLQQKFKLLVKNNRLPNSYYDEFSKSIFQKIKKVQQSKSRYLQKLKFEYQRQIQNFQHSSSFGQKINFLLQQRTTVLKQLKLMLIKQKIQIVDPQRKPSINLSYISQNLQKIRDISLRVIEHLALWKSSLDMDREDQYSREIVENISKDIQFLRLSSLRKFLEFSTSPDPLLLHSLKKFWKLELSTNYNSRAILNLFEVNDQYKTRLLNAQKFIKTFNPSQITSNYPFDDDYNHASQFQQSIQQANEEINEEIQAQHQIAKKHINLPSLAKNNPQKGSNNKRKKYSIQTSKQAEKGSSKVFELLKSIIDEAKQKKHSRPSRAMTNIYTPEKNISFKNEQKSLSLSRNNHDMEAPSYAKKGFTEANHRKYRLMTEQQYRIDESQNSVSKRNSIEEIRIKSDGKHMYPHLSEKRKKLQPLLNKSFVELSKRNNMDDINLSDEPNPYHSIEQEDEESQYEKGRINTSSKKTIKLPNKIQKDSEDFLNRKNQQEQEKNRQLLNKLNRYKNAPKRPNISYEISKNYQTENQSIENERYQRKNNQKDDEQLQKGVKKYQSPQNQSQNNKINWGQKKPKTKQILQDQQQPQSKKFQNKYTSPSQRRRLYQQQKKQHNSSRKNDSKVKSGKKKVSEASQREESIGSERNRNSKSKKVEKIAKQRPKALEENKNLKGQQLSDQIISQGPDNYDDNQQMRLNHSNSPKNKLQVKPRHVDRNNFINEKKNQQDQKQQSKLRASPLRMNSNRQIGKIKTTPFSPKNIHDHSFENNNKIRDDYSKQDHRMLPNKKFSSPISQQGEQSDNTRFDQYSTKPQEKVLPHIDRSNNPQKIQQNKQKEPNLNGNHRDPIQKNSDSVNNSKQKNGKKIIQPRQNTHKINKAPNKQSKDNISSNYIYAEQNQYDSYLNKNMSNVNNKTDVKNNDHQISLENPFLLEKEQNYHQGKETPINNLMDDKYFGSNNVLNNKNTIMSDPQKNKQQTNQFKSQNSRYQTLDPTYREKQGKEYLKNNEASKQIRYEEIRTEDKPQKQMQKRNINKDNLEKNVQNISNPLSDARGNDNLARNAKKIKNENQELNRMQKSSQDIVNYQQNFNNIEKKTIDPHPKNIQTKKTQQRIKNDQFTKNAQKKIPQNVFKKDKKQHDMNQLRLKQNKYKSEEQVNDHISSMKQQYDESYKNELKNNQFPREQIRLTEKNRHEINKVEQQQGKKGNNRFEKSKETIGQNQKGEFKGNQKLVKEFSPSLILSSKVSEAQNKIVPDLAQKKTNIEKNPSTQTNLQNPSNQTHLQNPSNQTHLQNPSNQTHLQNPSNQTHLQNPSNQTHLQNPSNQTHLQNPSTQTHLQNPSNQTQNPSTQTHLQNPSNQTQNPSNQTQNPSTQTHLQNPSNQTHLQNPSTQTQNPSNQTHLQNPSNQTHLQNPSNQTHLQNPSNQTHLQNPSNQTQNPSTQTHLQNPSNQTQNPSTQTHLQNPSNQTQNPSTQTHLQNPSNQTQNPSTQTHLQNPSNQTHLQNPSNQTHLQNPSTQTHLQNPSNQTHLQNPSNQTHLQNPSNQTHLQNPSNQTQNPSTQTHLQNPSNQTHLQNPSNQTQNPSTQTHLQNPSNQTHLQNPSNQTQNPSTQTHLQNPSNQTQNPSNQTQNPSTQTHLQNPSNQTHLQNPSNQTHLQNPSTQTQNPSNQTHLQNPSNQTHLQNPSNQTHLQNPSTQTHLQNPSTQTHLQNPSTQTQNPSTQTHLQNPSNQTHLQNPSNQTQNPSNQTHLQNPSNQTQNPSNQTQNPSNQTHLQNPSNQTHLQNPSTQTHLQNPSNQTQNPSNQTHLQNPSNQTHLQNPSNQTHLQNPSNQTHLQNPSNQTQNPSNQTHLQNPSNQTHLQNPSNQTHLQNPSNQTHLQNPSNQTQNPSNQTHLQNPSNQTHLQNPSNQTHLQNPSNQTQNPSNQTHLQNPSNQTQNPSNQTHLQNPSTQTHLQNPSNQTQNPSNQTHLQNPSNQTHLQNPSNQTHLQNPSNQTHLQNPSNQTQNPSNQTHLQNPSNQTHLQNPSNQTHLQNPSNQTHLQNPSNQTHLQNPSNQTQNPSNQTHLQNPSNQTQNPSNQTQNPSNYISLNNSQNNTIPLENNSTSTPIHKNPTFTYAQQLQTITQQQSQANTNSPQFKTINSSHIHLMQDFNLQHSSSTNQPASFMTLKRMQNSFLKPSSLPSKQQNSEKSSKTITVNDSHQSNPIYPNVSENKQNLQSKNQNQYLPTNNNGNKNQANILQGQKTINSKQIQNNQSNQVNTNQRQFQANNSNSISQNQNMNNLNPPKQNQTNQPNQNQVLHKTNETSSIPIPKPMTNNSPHLYQSTVTQKSQRHFKPQLKSQNEQKYQTSSERKSMQSSINPNSLTKCIFQSRSLPHKQLSKLLLSYKVHEKIVKQIEQDYFSYRHLCLNLCLLNNQVISIVLAHPTFIGSQRFVVLVLFKVVSPKYLQMSTRLLSTAVRYLFFNDPCENIIVLKPKPEFEDQFDKVIYQQGFTKQIKNVKGMIINIFVQANKYGQKNTVFEQKCYFIMRKDNPCKNDQLYLNNLEFEINIIGKKNSKIPSKMGKLQLSKNHRQTVQKVFLGESSDPKTIKKFATKQSFSDYIIDQELQDLEKAASSISNSQTNIFMYERILYNFSSDVKYFSYGGVFYFLLDNNCTWYWEKNQIGYFIVKCQIDKNKNSQTGQKPGSGMSSWLKNDDVDKNKRNLDYYFVFIDYVFESQNPVPAMDLIEKQIQSKKSDQILQTSKQFQNKLMTVPCFDSKQLIDNYKSETLIINSKMNLNWRNYLKGVRSIPQDQILTEYIAPFYFGLIMKDENDLMRFVCGTHINKNQQKIQQ